jgi:hypothetical protein
MVDKRETDKNYPNYKLMRDPLLNKNVGVFHSFVPSQFAFLFT